MALTLKQGVGGTGTMFFSRYCGGEIAWVVLWYLSSKRTSLYVRAFLRSSDL